MALLGSSVDPSLFIQDYSGFTRAAGIQAQGMSNFGSQIAGGIDKYSEKKLERKKLDAGIKATVTGIESAIKMGKSLGIDVESSLTPYLDKINDPNTTPTEAAAYAQQASNSISNVLNFGTKANELNAQKAQSNAAVAAKIAELKDSKWQPYDKEIEINGRKVKLTGSLDQKGQFKDIANNVYPSVADAFAPAGQTSAAGITSALGGGPPMDIPTVEGPLIPANEGVISEDGTKVSYRGGLYTVDPGVLAARTPNGPAAAQPATQSPRQPRLPAGSSLVTDKPLGKFRKATAEQAAEYNALAGQFDEENRFYPAPVPTGAEVITENGKTTVRYGAGVGGKPTVKLGEGQQLVPDPSSPTGTRVANIPGGAAEQAAQQAASAEVAARNRAVEIGKVAISEIDRFIDYTGKMSELPFASSARKILGDLGFQEQAEAQSSLDTVSANLKFEALDGLRKSSPSGSSGLGQVTQNEFSALADQWGTLRLVGDPEKIRERAISIKTKLLDVVHGTQQHRESLLKKGIITSDQYNEIQSQYPGGKQATQEDDKIKGYRATFPSQLTQ